MKDSAAINDDVMIKINEIKIYEDIYAIFEEEFSEIGRYIAFSEHNLKTYSNKIHELHLRVCSEIENLLKIIIHSWFSDIEQITKDWDSKKSERLGDNLQKYIELKNSLNSNDRRRLEVELFGKPDFKFYLDIAREKFNLHKKAVNFKGGIYQSKNSLKEFVPFHAENSDNNIPPWWTAYNKLKHDKISSYSSCNLGHLIHALAGLYLLMLYRKHYQKDNKKKEDHDFLSRHPNANYSGLDIFEGESKLFYTMPHSDISMMVAFSMQPIVISEEQYNLVKNYPKFVIDAKSEGILDPQSRVFSVEIDYKQVANIDPRNPPQKVEKRHLMRQKTRYISFVN